jgi:hypothetical protein
VGTPRNSAEYMLKIKHYTTALVSRYFKEKKMGSAVLVADWQTDRLTDWKTDRLTDWQTDRLTDWQTDRLTDW